MFGSLAGAFVGIQCTLRMARALHGCGGIMATIVLDPGHGGDTNLLGSTANNAVGPSGTLEKTLTLDVALRAATQLRAANHTVLLTRERDVNVSAADRIRVAREAGAHVFLSIHFNGFHVPSVQGTETLVRPPSGQGIAALDAGSSSLARCVQAHLVGALGLRDRGLKPGRWAVLSDALHRAETARCLAECSFLTDPAEELRLVNESYRERIATALAAGVTEHLAALLARAQAYGRTVSVARAGARTSSRWRGPDPDAYGYVDAGSEEEGEGAENDVGEPIAVIQQVPEQSDAHCPESYAENASSAHFSLAEFRCRDGTDCPARFRGHLQLLMDNLEVLRDELGGSGIRINSGYRTPTYNRSIGGARQSKHMCGMAADFTVEGQSLQTVYDTIERLISEGRMREGGLSKYTSFVHYDVRGQRIRWSA